MTKQKSGWKRRLTTELDLVFELVTHHAMEGHVRAAREVLMRADRILTKPRACKACGEIYYHDDLPGTYRCNDCDDEYAETARLEETPEQRRDSELEQLDAERRGGAQ